MATFKLTINPGYVPDWTSDWEALREFVQNGLDAHDKGFEFRATWNKANNQLKLVNRGARIDRKHLLMGSTSKADDTAARGHFGEGFKLGLLVLARSNVRVRIRTGGETWHPEIVHSEEFGSDLLQIRTSPCKDDGNLTVLVDNVTKASWETLQKLVLFLRPKAPTRASTSHGDLLLDPDDKGRVFVKGIFTYNDAKLSYGYDFKNLRLDRDRKMANVYDLELAVRNVMSEAVASGALKAKELLNLMHDTNTREASSFETYGISYGIGNALKEAFVEAHGEDAIPVSSMGTATELRASGLRAIVAPRAIETLFNSNEIIKAKTEQNALKVNEIVQADELTDDECEVWRKGMSILNAVEPTLAEYAIQVVVFANDKTMGSIEYSSRIIRVARRELKSVGKLVGTIIHELAHRGASDHSPDHAAAMELLFEKAIDEMAKRL